MEYREWTESSDPGSFKTGGYGQNKAQVKNTRAPPERRLLKFEHSFAYRRSDAFTGILHWRRRVDAVRAPPSAVRVLQQAQEGRVGLMSLGCWDFRGVTKKTPT